MYYLILLIILTAALTYLFFKKPLKVAFLLDSDEMKMMADIIWLKAIRAEVRVIGFSPHITFYFLGRRVFSKILKGKTDMSFTGALSLRDTRIKTFYGLTAPHLTGIFYAASAFLASLVDSAALEQYPEYVPQREYLKIEAHTDIDLGRTALNLVKQRFSRTKRRDIPWIRQS